MNDEFITQEVVYRSNKGTPVTDSLKVSKVFGMLHKNVIQAIRGLAENSADVKRWFYQATYEDVQGRPQPLYIMNRDGFSLLAMGFTGPKALQFKVGFIEQFNKMEAMLKEAAQRNQIPQTFAEALRLAAEQAEIIEKQQKQLEDERPRVLFSQAVETAKQSVLIGELAKIICQNGVEIGEKRLFKWLRDNHYLCAYGERYNQPTQKAIEQGLFELRKITINTCDKTRVSTTTKVTGKGQVYFVYKFLNANQ